MQCGGWSLTWQGNDTSNADFPGAESVTAAMKRAVESGGGRLVNGSDLTGQDRPDVAVLVYGEQPYAEMHGDIQFALYNVGEPLAQLKRLQRAAIPTVTVFLSGRPLWTRPELEASDAFVAAWLPGTEGGGIADVLIGDAAGRPRYDFTGRLSFTWPNDRLRAGTQPCRAAGSMASGIRPSLRAASGLPKGVINSDRRVKRRRRTGNPFPGSARRPQTSKVEQSVGSN